ncbi:Pfmc-2TM Maurer's cleft two transmembrane, putative [Plasmodium sp.]|nr:Pfmc-2TM Maurer's cleft two transmembrane, putative [Plasmodium sp.]
MNRIEIGTYKLPQNNGGIQFRMLAQKKTNTQPYGNTLGNILLYVKNVKDNKIVNNKTKVNKTVNNKTKVNKTLYNKTKVNKIVYNKPKDNKIKDNKTKQNKTKDRDPKISYLFKLVDNMNISQDKKDKIRTLTLNYRDSDDKVEKNKSINELKKYSNEEEYKEHMDNYLMHLRMQDDIKYLKRENFWNKMGSVAITLLLIIILIVIISLDISNGAGGYTFLLISIPIIYIFARFFPEIKLRFKKLKENYTNFFIKKGK